VQASERNQQRSGGKRLERLVGLPALDADHGKAELAQPVKQDRRHAIAGELAKAPSCRRIVFETGRVEEETRYGLLRRPRYLNG
jgi:hypothetical protein